jgi:hypothetical protein
MSKIRTARKLTRQAGLQAQLADCLVCVRLRARAFDKADSLIGMVRVTLPSRF